MAGLTSTRRWVLRRIFLQKRSTYSPSEAARVLSMPRKTIVSMIESYALDAETKVRKNHYIPWAAIAQVALDRFTIGHLIEALGKQATEIIPPLLFPAEPMQVTLPIYLVKLLEHRAAEQGITTDECLAMMLRSYVEDSFKSLDAMEKAIPGFLDALCFPEEPVSLTAPD